MILLDSSAWVEFFRRTDSATHHRVRTALGAGEVCVTDIVRLELLAGTFRGRTPQDVSQLLDSCNDLAQSRVHDVEAAASIYRTCRSRGETVRALNECVLAAVAVRHGVPVLHRDRDFDVIARYTELEAMSA